jgi:hypothetical protein
MTIFPTGKHEAMKPIKKPEAFSPLLALVPKLHLGTHMSPQLRRLPADKIPLMTPKNLHENH